jgi:hypothetical protein
MPNAAPSLWNQGPGVSRLRFEPLAKVEGFFLTATQIQTELDAILLAILRITESKVSTFSTGGRQVAFEGAGKLEALYKRQSYLESELARMNRGVSGIPVRYGVVRG